MKPCTPLLGDASAGGVAAPSTTHYGRRTRRVSAAAVVTTASPDFPACRWSRRDEGDAKMLRILGLRK